MIIKEIFAPEEKTQICLNTLHTLPDWFAVGESVQDYAQQVRGQVFFAAFEDEKCIGFLSLKIHNPYTAEIYVMGVVSGSHRTGAGTVLMQAAENRCREEKLRFLTVKTLDCTADYAPYDQTRSFYRKMGFVPLEVFTTLWDADNPCLFLGKYLQ